MFVALQSLTALFLVKGFNRVEYRVRPSGPVVQPGMLTSQVSGRRTSGLQTSIWSRDRKVAGSNPARSTKNFEVVGPFLGLYTRAGDNPWPVAFFVGSELRYATSVLKHGRNQPQCAYTL